LRLYQKRVNVWNLMRKNENEHEIETIQNEKYEKERKELADLGRVAFLL